MCRSCAEGGRRCPGETAEKRRARQNAAYHARKHAADPRDDTAPGSDAGAEDSGGGGVPDPLDGPVSPEMVRERIQHAQEVLERAEWRKDDKVADAYTMGELLNEEDEDGWSKPTPYGLEAEQATRDAGAAVAARARDLAAPDLERVRDDKTVRSFVHLDDEVMHKVFPSVDGPPTRTQYGKYLGMEYLNRRKEAERYFEAGANADDPGQQRALAGLAKDNTEEAQRYQQEFARWGQGDSAWDRAESRAWSDAYRTALAEQRDLGMPKGGSLGLDHRSQKAATKRLDTAVGYYPTDWLQREGPAATPFNQIGEADRAKFNLPETLELRVQGTTGRAYYAPLEGRRTAYSDGTFKNDFYAGLHINNRDVGCLGPGVSNAVHEYGHRTEAVTTPRVNDLMQTFLARRTTNPDGTRQKLEPYLVGKQRSKAGPAATLDEFRAKDEGKHEWVRPDSFVEQYTGKQNSSIDDSSEVFTTGMEGVFAGRFGGLRGVGRWREDTEHRDLILGTLAAVK